MLKKEHIAAKVFRDISWHFTGKDNELFITFDDGPTPEITQWVLSCLHEYEAKATFFCIGQNVIKYPNLYKQILDEGHSVGNHTHNHNNGWYSNTKAYIQSVRKAAEVIDSNLFRPPYGRIRPKQITYLNKDFKIIMWDVLTKDYSSKLDKEKCLKQTMEHTESGSIIVFHDTLKAEKNLKYVLPRFLKHFTELGYIFNPIEFKNQLIS